MSRILLLLVVGALATGCKTPFTQSMRTYLDQSDPAAIGKVQFYIDREIRIQRSSIDRETAITKGTVEFRDGRYYYTISFPRNTPAVAVQHGTDGLKVYFEEGATRYLIFKNFDGSQTYRLAGKREDRGFVVNYEGKPYTVIAGAGVYLNIKKHHVNSVQSERRKVKGRRVE